MLARWIAEEVHGRAPTPKYQAGHICHDEQIEKCPLKLPKFDFHRLGCAPHTFAWQTAREHYGKFSVNGVSRCHEPPPCGAELGEVGG